MDRTAVRFSVMDRLNMADAIDRHIDFTARKTLARYVAVDDLTPFMHAAVTAIGCGFYDLRDKEIEEVRAMVIKALDTEHARENPRYGVRIGYARN